MNGRLAIAALWLLLASLYIATAVEGTPVVEAKCDPGRPHQENPDPGTGGNYFDGWFRNSSAWVTGVIADIYNYSPWVEPINGFISASLATVMLAESAPNGDDYAQVGWVEYPYGYRRTFVQYTIWENGFQYTRHREDWTPQPVGTWSTYEVRLNLNNSKYEFWVNSALKYSAGATFLPRSGQTFGELTTAANQMAGGYNGYEWFLNNKMQVAGVWSALKGNQVTDEPSWFGWERGDLTGYMLKIWDKACPQ
jgi:hypothetical protein